MYYLIYRSQATKALAASHLTSLLEQSRTFNLRHDLTGLLLYTPDQQFLQVLEGDKEDVRTLYYERIVADIRHQNCWVLSEGHWLHRSFPDWSMGLLTDQELDSSTEPGFLEISRLRLMLPLLARDHPASGRVLLEFVGRYDEVS